ncbi:MAG: CDP-alcohol phosphatidyltransferase family protein [Nanoarchaeota archaeon]|nr:CDP-alcohol phosphatidyltransferase family protein [Nanoarchaeota archaeon]
MKQKERIVNWPNFFTTLRVIITFVIVYAVFTDVSIFSIAVLFVIGMITDAIDGNIARIWNMKTEFGRRYDQFADRFLLVATVISFMVHYPMTGYFGREQIYQMFIMLAREIIGFPFAVAYFILSKHWTPHATHIAKATTVLQAIALPAIVFKMSIAWPFAITTGIIGAFSALNYIRDLKEVYRKRGL